FVIDTGGQTLKNLLKYKPFLIKPNHHELSDLLGVEIHSKEDVLQYAENLLDLGPTNILVTLGGEGAVLVSEETIAYANVPKGELKNSVGAGDSTVAGYLASFVETGDLLHAFKTGVACGSATAFSEDLCTKSEMEILLPQIAVKTIEKE
ncbi:1-phosphofructokinase family hexose kinase, partial [Streptomyces gulbargensis]